MRAAYAALVAATLFSARAQCEALSPVPLDWRVLASGPERVLFLGDSHDFKDARLELASSMDRLREAGITHITLEMLPADAQPWLDRFHADGSCRGTIREHMERFWQDGPDDLADAYLQLLDRARSAGIKAVAMDIREKYKRRLRPQLVPQDCSWRLPAAEADYEAALAACPVGHDPRDCAMVYRIAQTLAEDPRSRVLAFVGAWHVRSSRQPALLSSLHGARSRSYSFLTELVAFTEDNRQDGAAAALISSLRRRATPEKLLLPLDRERYLMDGVLWLPGEYRQADWHQRNARRLGGG
ncbi:MAG: ChaN family lipoprotein [Elusimicrobia bacterium]|nr:ChaN family lipoprotein [Elusimicrobiota bacterium]